MYGALYACKMEGHGMLVVPVGLLLECWSGDIRVMSQAWTLPLSFLLQKYSNTAGVMCPASQKVWEECKPPDGVGPRPGESGRKDIW